MKNSPNYVALEFNFAYLRESHSFLRDYCNRIKGDFHSYCQIMFKEKGSDGMLLIQQVSEKLIGVKDSLESVLQVMELKGTHVQFDFNPMNTL